MKIEDIKFIPIKSSDYGTKIIGNPIMNYPQWHSWSSKYWSRGVTREMFDKGCNLTGDNRERFKKLFGKRNFTFNGSHYFHGWVADLVTTKLLILTAKEHGTVYELVEIWDNQKIQKDIDRALEFLDMLAEIPDSPQNV